MKKRISLAVLALLASCFAGGSAVSLNTFQDVSIGTSQPDVVTALGKPYAVHKKADGTIEYEYIERFQTGGRTINERHYFIIMKDGRVVSKRVSQSSPNPYGFDSYDMQTTQNQDSAPPEISP